MELDIVWRPNPAVTARAVERARSVLNGTEAATHLENYYTSANDYAGSTFLDLKPNDPYQVSPADLLAVTTLSVSIHPRAIRSFDASSSNLTRLLERLDPELRLEVADPSIVAGPMAEFYEAVKICLRRAGAQTSNPWVTTSKICARKRPHLFPVRDNVVLDFLGLPKTYPVDWPAFQALLSDGESLIALTGHVRGLRGKEGVDVGDELHLLRHLDVALWMHAIATTRLHSRR